MSSRGPTRIISCVPSFKSSSLIQEVFFLITLPLSPPLQYHGHHTRGCKHSFCMENQEDCENQSHYLLIQNVNWYWDRSVSWCLKANALFEITCNFLGHCQGLGVFLAFCSPPYLHHSLLSSGSRAKKRQWLLASLLGKYYVFLFYNHQNMWLNIYSQTMWWL